MYARYHQFTDCITNPITYYHQFRQEFIGVQSDLQTHNENTK